MKDSNSSLSKKNHHKATTLKGREDQLCALAIDLAEQKLRDGTASSQIICHYLKLGSSREKLEQEQLKKQTELISAKKEAVESAQRMEERYENAFKAIRSYNGLEDGDY